MLSIFGSIVRFQTSKWRDETAADCPPAMRLCCNRTYFCWSIPRRFIGSFLWLGGVPVDIRVCTKLWSSNLLETSCNWASFMIVYHVANEENGAQFPTPVYTNFTPDGGSDGYNGRKISGAAWNRWNKHHHATRFWLFRFFIISPLSYLFCTHINSYIKAHEPCAAALNWR